MNTTRTDSGRRRRRWRWWAIAGIGLIIIAALATGYPQHWALERAVSRTLNGAVTISGLSLLGSLRAERIEIAGQDDQGALLPALAVVEGLDIDYRILASRSIKAMTVDRIVVQAITPDSGTSNFAFLFEGPDAAGPYVPLRFLPETVNVADLRVVRRIRNGELDLSNVSVTAEFPSAAEGVIELEGDAIQLRSRAGTGAMPDNSYTGSAALELRLSQEDVSLSGGAVVGQVGQCAFEAQARLNETWMERDAVIADWSARIDSGSLDGDAFAGFLEEATSNRFAFSSIVLNPVQAESYSGDAAAMPKVIGGFVAAGVRVGPVEEPWYQGDAEVDVSIPGGEETEGRFDLVLANGALVHGAIAGSQANGRAEITLLPWSREELRSVVPPLHRLLKAADASEFQGVADLTWTSESIAVDLYAGDAAYETLTVDATATMGRGESGVIESKTIAEFAGSEWSLTFDRSAEGAVAARIDGGGLSAGTAYRIASAAEPPAGTQGILRATAALQQADSESDMILEGTASLEGASFGETAIGDLAATYSANIASGEESENRFDLALASGAQVHGAITGSRANGQAEITLSPWSREELRSVVPPLHRLLQAADASEFQGVVDLAWTSESIAVDLHAGDAAHETLTVDATAKIARGESGMIESKAIAKFAGSEWSLGFNRTAEGVTAARIDGGGLSAGTAYRIASAAKPPAGTQGILRATAAMQQADSESDMILEGTASLEGASFGETAIGDLTATYSANVAGGKIAAGAIIVEAGDGITRLVIEDLHGSWSQIELEAAATSTIEMMTAGNWMGQSDLWGELSVSGPVTIANGRLTAPVEMRSDYLGYGDLALPYGSEMVGETEFTYDFGAHRWNADGARLNVGEGSTLTFETLKGALEPIAVDISGRAISNLTLLADMGLFASVDGSGDATFDARYTDGKLTGSWQSNADVALAILPNEVSAVTGIRENIRGTIDGDISGQGEVTLESLTVAGARMEDLRSPVTLEGAALEFNDFRGDLFGGRAIFEVGVMVNDAEFPTRLTGRIDQFDLARFTEEVKPPEVRMTGIADATFDLTAGMDGLRSFQVAGTSYRNFSLNRDIVRTLLDTEAFNVSLSSSQIQKTLDKFLGTSPQRPFDSATMNLGDEADRIVGQAVLKSDKTSDYNGLNLTIELAIDEEALIQWLKALEEGRIQNVQF